MRAVVHDRYGPPEVLRVEEVERPVPGSDELLVKVYATTVTRSDCAFRSAKPFISRLFTGLMRPTQPIVGTEFAGVVEEVGESVTEFEVGEAVFGIKRGANAEYLCVRETSPVARKPDGITFEEAAAVPDGFILAGGPLRRAGIASGDRILVYGASGSIGTASVQLAKASGAHVTAVCDTRHVELVASLGADEVIDYTQEDFTANAETYDIVFDAVGKISYRRSKGSLTRSGVYLATDGLANLFLWLWTRWIGRRRVIVDIPPRYAKEEIVSLQRLVEAGRYRAVIGRRYPLEEVVEATRYVETGQKTGSVVLTVVRNEPSP